MVQGPLPVTDRGRIGALDGLRGLGALLVMVVHYIYRGPSLYPEIGQPIEGVQFISYAIGMFFVVSGFVITMSLRSTTVTRFAASRAIRLYPAYWACLLITFGVVAVAGLPGREVTLSEALINLTMLQSYLGVPPVDAASWTLGVELAFYVQCILVIAWGAVRGRALDVAIGIGLAVSLAAIVADRLVAWPLTGAAVQAFGWTGYFVIGATLFRVWSGERHWTVLAFLAPVSAVIIAVREPAEGLAALALTVIVAYAIWGPSGWLGSRVMRWLGGISYVLYLLHQNVGYVAMRALNPRLGQVAGTVVVAVGMLALATLVTYLVDVPVRRLLRVRFFGRARPAADSSAERSAAA